MSLPPTRAWPGFSSEEGPSAELVTGVAGTAGTGGGPGWAGAERNTGAVSGWSSVIVPAPLPVPAVGAKATTLRRWALSPEPITISLLTSMLFVEETGIVVEPAGVSAAMVVARGRRMNERASPVATWSVGVAPPGVGAAVRATSKNSGPLISFPK